MKRTTTTTTTNSGVDCVGQKAAIFTHLLQVDWPPFVFGLLVFALFHQDEDSVCVVVNICVWFHLLLMYTCINNLCILFCLVMVVLFNYNCLMLFLCTVCLTIIIAFVSDRVFVCRSESPHTIIQRDHIPFS